MNSAAHATAPSSSPIRTNSRSVTSETNQKTRSRCTSTAMSVTAPITKSAIQIRSAIRPTRRLPASSWADPGATSVITISDMARRKRTRAARSVTGDIQDLLLGEGSSGDAQYHQSHASHVGATRRGCLQIQTPL